MNLEDPWNLTFLVAFVGYTGVRHTYSKRVQGEATVTRHVDGLEKALLFPVLLGSLLAPLLFLFTPWLGFADYALPPVLRSVGIVLLIAALWLFWRAHADLGRNWSMSLEIREEHELVSHGVYRRMRHPMYAAIWLWSLGQGLTLDNWLAGWTALVTFSLLYFVRVPREEALMGETFGEAYREYEERTGRIVPRPRKKP